MIAPRPIYALLMAGAAGIASTSNVSAAPDGIACANFETVTFPTVGPGVTTWDICYQAENKHGLTLQSVSFKKSSSFPSIQILSDARLAEMFVPYHSGHPRVFDIRDSSVALLSLSSTDCPPPHSLIDGGLVCKELRDRGVAWKNNGLVRRGEELVLWSVLGGATYNYIIEWRFHDEGTIVGQVGLTGPKNEGPNDNRGHMHNATWRLDIDLNGAKGDSVFKTKHIESEGSLVATDSEVLIATERGIVWKPTQFTTLKIGDSALVNGRGHPTSYELISVRRGIARHAEAYTQKDFWVTRYNPGETLAPDLPTYADGESVVNTDIVVWYTCSGHHEQDMRDEDRNTVPVKWIGFELVPQNLFNRTPFYPR